MTATFDDLGDRELMRLALEGDRGAFGALFERNADGIWRAAYLLLHGSAGADDALQDTFARGLDFLSTYRGEAEPRVWLYSIALNVCRRALRVGREKTVEASGLEAGRRLTGRPRGVVTSVLRREQSRRLAVALGYLPPRQRETFVLHHVENVPFDDIARMLGISHDAARQLAQRAKASLREQLGPDNPLVASA